MAGGDGHDGKARVLVIEPHPVTRIGICSLIDGQPNLTLIGRAGSLAEALACMKGERIALIVLEPLLGRRDSPEKLIAALTRAAPTARILALSARQETDWVDDVLRAGVSGFISKGESGQRVVGAIRDVLAGREVVVGVGSGNP